MSLSYVSLTCDLLDGAASPVTEGSLIFTPDQTLASTSDHVTVTRIPVTVSLLGSPQPVVQLLATDSAGISPPGWSWTLTCRFPGAPPPQSFPLAFADGAQQYLSAVLAP